MELVKIYSELAADIQVEMTGDSRSETTLIHAIVNIVVNPLIQLVNLTSQSLGQQIHAAILLVQQIVKHMVEHANDLTALIVDDAFLNLVVQSGDSETALVVWILLEVDVAEMCVGLVERVRSDVLARELLVARCKAPAWCQR